MLPTALWDWRSSLREASSIPRREAAKRPLGAVRVGVPCRGHIRGQWNMHLRRDDPPNLALWQTANVSGRAASDSMAVLPAVNRWTSTRFGQIRTDGVTRKRRNELNRFKVQAKELLTTLARPSMFRNFAKLLQSASNPSAKNTLLMLSWGSGSDPLKANLTDPVYSAITPVVPPLLNVIEHE